MAKDKEDEVQYYVGKTFLVKLPTGILGIIHVVDFKEKGEEYDGDSYVGWITYIFKDGRSTENPWSCSREVFEQKEKQLIRG